MFSVPIDELKRKGFHLLSLIYAFGYWYLDKKTVVTGLTIAIAVVALLEFLRLKVPSFNNFFCANFKGFYRPNEAKKISGLLGTLSGALITILVFQDKYAVFASFLFLAFGDSLAALAGKTFGRHKIVFGKTLEGSAACFAACLICGLFLFDLKLALLGAAAATVVEVFPWKINDNFWMQIVNAGILTFFSGVI